MSCLQSIPPAHRLKVFSRRNLSSSVIRYRVKSFREIPGPLRLPIWGNLYLYKLGIYNRLKYHEVLKDLHKKYGPLVRQDLGMKTIIHVFDPEDVRTIYEAEGKSPHVEPLQETVMLYRKQRKISLGLGNMNGEEWYRLRSAVQQMMLRPTEVHYYLPHINEVASDFIERIRRKTKGNGELGKLREEVSKWSLESAGMVCFETRLGSLGGGEGEKQATRMVEANRKIFEISSTLKFSLQLFKVFSTPQWTTMVKEEDFFYGIGGSYVDKTISKIKDLQEQNKMGERRNHFLTYLLSKPELSYSDIKIITLSLFGDGLSTPGAEQKDTEVVSESSQFSAEYGAKNSVDLVNKLSMKKIHKKCMLISFDGSNLFTGMDQKEGVYLAEIILLQKSFPAPITTPTLICNVYCLATNPEVQEKAFKEVSSVYNGGQITIEMINQMPYLKGVIKETFRVYPNGTEVSRILLKDLVLSGYTIPAGTHCNMNQSVQYKSKEYFKDPEKFMPERWLRGESSSNIHPFLLIPFGIKARTCAGRRFAEQDLIVTIALILYNFKLKCHLNRPLEQYYNILLFPEDSLKIHFESRF